MHKMEKEKCSHGEEPMQYMRQLPSRPFSVSAYLTFRGRAIWNKKNKNKKNQYSGKSITKQKVRKRTPFFFIFHFLPKKNSPQEKYVGCLTLR